MADLLSSLQDYQHVLLVGGVIWAYFRFKKLQDEAQREAKEVIESRHIAAKEEIHAALANGIGDLIDKKNMEQDTRWQLALRAEFVQHEQREESNIRSLIMPITSRLDRLEDEILRNRDALYDNRRELTKRTR